MTTMREEMHKALDTRINELKKKGFDFDREGPGTLMSDVKTEGKLLRISLMLPIEPMSLKELQSFLKSKTKR